MDDSVEEGEWGEGGTTLTRMASTDAPSVARPPRQHSTEVRYTLVNGHVD